MPFEPIIPNPSARRFLRYRLRRQAVGAAGAGPAQPLFAARRLSCALFSPLTSPFSCTGSQRPGRCKFTRRVLRPHQADGRRQSALAAVAETCRRVQADPALARCGQSVPPATGVSVSREIMRGMAIGVIACLALVWLAGASALSYVAAVVWGSCFGALIGMLLWIGSAEAPEDPVLPPAPGQARGEKPDRSRPRR